MLGLKLEQNARDHLQAPIKSTINDDDDDAGIGPLDSFLLLLSGRAAKTLFRHNQPPSPIDGNPCSRNTSSWRSHNFQA